MNNYEANLKKINDESLLCYAMILNYINNECDETDEFMQMFKKHILQKCASGENIEGSSSEY